jgi:hypothetical protein
MSRSNSLLVVFGMLLALASVPCLAVDFAPYAGSKLDEKVSRESSAAAPGTQSEVYTTTDSFDKVYAFYKNLYKEYKMPPSPMKLPSGEPIKWAFFILDGGKNLSVSKHWMKIQRPYVGRASTDVRDVTVIQVVLAK